jgi:Winged helix DNA-binding domain
VSAAPGADQVRAWRLRRHRLDAPAPHDALLDVAAELCGIHAQLAASAELALSLRVEGLAPGDVDRLLWEERALVKTWAVRGTLHLLPARELGLWHAALGTYRHFTKPSWYRAFGITAEELEALIEAVGTALRDRVLTRAELADEVARATGSASLAERLRESWGAYLKPASFRGELVFGPSAGQNVRFTHPATWLGDLEAVDPDAALQEVARRYLSAYGPAAREDLGRWWGVSPAQAGKLIARLDEAAEVDAGGRRGFMLAADAEAAAALDPPSSVRLLPAFDPYVVGSVRTDTDVLAEQHRARVHRPQGWISPVLLVDGRMAGVWKHERAKGRVRIDIEPFGRVPKTVRAGAEEQAAALAAYLGGEAELRWAAPARRRADRP